MSRLGHRDLRLEPFQRAPNQTPNSWLKRSEITRRTLPTVAPSSCNWALEPLEQTFCCLLALLSAYFPAFPPFPTPYTR
jgi:hypothetical protein